MNIRCCILFIIMLLCSTISACAEKNTFPLSGSINPYFTFAEDGNLYFTHQENRGSLFGSKNSLYCYSPVKKKINKVLTVRDDRSDIQVMTGAVFFSNSNSWIRKPYVVEDTWFTVELSKYSVNSKKWEKLWNNEKESSFVQYRTTLTECFMLKTENMVRDGYRLYKYTENGGEYLFDCPSMMSAHTFLFIGQTIDDECIDSCIIYDPVKKRILSIPYPELFFPEMVLLDDDVYYVHNNSVYHYDVISETKHRLLKLESQKATSLCYDEGMLYVIQRGEGKVNIREYSLEMQNETKRISLSSNELQGISYIVSDSVLYSGYVDQEYIHTYDLNTGEIGTIRITD